jgi:hypothetical protein
MFNPEMKNPTEGPQWEVYCISLYSKKMSVGATGDHFCSMFNPELKNPTEGAQMEVYFTIAKK